MKKLAAKILAGITRKILRKYKPRIIGITGSVGKTSAKEAVFVALAPRFRTRAGRKNYNNEFGLPLAVLGADSPGRNIFKWIALLWRGIWTAYAYVQFPEILVLEMGVDRPGDMDYLLSMAKPDYAVLTSIGVPHLENFSTQERILQEKTKIFSAIGRQGAAILNLDDKLIRSAVHTIKGRISTYGFDHSADLRINDYQITYGRTQKAYGTMFRMVYKGETVPVFLSGTIGVPHIMACAAAAAVALNFGLTLKEIAENLEDYKSMPGRLHLVEGQHHSTIIDDTYNSSPASVAAAVNELKEFPAQHKIAVLGDMLELGRVSDSAHLDVGRLLLNNPFEQVILVGPRLRSAADFLRRSGFPSDRVMHFEKSTEALEPVRQLIRDGSAILVKGSQGIRMEKIVKGIMAEPERASELLCRQDKKWLKS